MPSLRVALFLPAIREDIRGILRWSKENFGEAAATRYEKLIRQAMRDIQADPERPGAKRRLDLSPDAFVYHLAYSRHIEGEKVKSPRHFLLYRYSDSEVEFARILHDNRDLARHLPSEYGSLR